MSLHSGTGAAPRRRRLRSTLRPAGWRRTIRKAGTLGVLAFFAILAGTGAALTAQDGTDTSGGPRVLVMDVQDAIGPATRDFLKRGFERAERNNAALIVVRMDAPGGLDASTRDIVKDISDSDVPVATCVAPRGARAASAGTYILLASHLAVMSPATNVGAATPVAIVGGTKPERPPGKPVADETTETSESAESTEPDATPEEPSALADTMERKAINDAVAYIRGLAAEHGRNADWAERAVREAESITAEQALELGVIDFIAKGLDELLRQANGQSVVVQGAERTLETADPAIEELKPD